MNLVRNIPWLPVLRSPSEEYISSNMLLICFLSKLGFSSSFFTLSHQSFEDQMAIINNKWVAAWLIYGWTCNVARFHYLKKHLRVCELLQRINKVLHRSSLIQHAPEPVDTHTHSIDKQTFLYTIVFFSLSLKQNIRHFTCWHIPAAGGL